MIDWNYDEDRSRIRTGHGPENITRLRRFAIGVLKSKGRGGVAQKMRRLTRNVSLVLDYLRMSENSCACRVRETPSENDTILTGGGGWRGVEPLWCMEAISPGYGCCMSVY